MGIDILILGFTFKENCSDTRNKKVLDIVNELKDFQIKSYIVDPWLDQSEVCDLYGLKVNSKLLFTKKYDAVLLAVGHDEFKKINIEQWKSLINSKGIYFDLQNIIPRELMPIRI